MAPDLGLPDRDPGGAIGPGGGRLRVGVGYDAHRFAEDRPLILGGVEIPSDVGLAGYSDGDAVCHAVIDAILGAAGAGSIGEMFPSGDEKWKGARSIELLSRTLMVLRNRGLQIVNVDVSVVCEEPKIAPHAPAIREKLGRVLGIGAPGVSIKGKTNDGMGWIGAGEGMAVHAVALIRSLEEDVRLGAPPRESSVL